MNAKNRFLNLSILIIACSARGAQGRVSGGSVGKGEASALAVVHTVTPALAANAKCLPLAVRACLPRYYPTAGLFSSQHLRELPARELKRKPAVKS